MMYLFRGKFGGGRFEVLADSYRELEMLASLALGFYSEGFKGTTEFTAPRSVGEHGEVGSRSLTRFRPCRGLSWKA
jgi:hypothetical protein